MEPKLCADVANPVLAHFMVKLETVRVLAAAGVETALRGAVGARAVCPSSMALLNTIPKQVLLLS